MNINEPFNLNSFWYDDRTNETEKENKNSDAFFNCCDRNRKTLCTRQEYMTETEVEYSIENSFSTSFMDYTSF